jgi:hypothetical protein
MHPNKPHVKNITLKYTRRRDGTSFHTPREDEDEVPIQNNGTFISFRWSNAGSNRVKGTDVRAPIKATKSVKKGTAFATKYVVITTNNVNTAHRILCLDANPNFVIL